MLGVDPDERIAKYARQRGFEVDVARFEEWDPAGRTFDGVIAGQTWHWVDPVAGARKAAEVLRPGGRLAVFWNAMELPPTLREALADAFRRAVPEATAPSAGPGGPAGYSAFLASAAAGMRQVRAFSEPEQWQVDWQHPCSRDEWLDGIPTAGGFNRLQPETLDVLVAQVGAAVDAIGGTFTMRYAAVAVTACKTGPPAPSPGGWCSSLALLTPETEA